MFERCVVPGCRILSGKGVGLFDFPNGSHNTRRRALWLKNLGLSESDLSSLSRVCERHFGPGNIVVYPSGGCRLMAGAVPNIIRKTSMQTFDDSKSSASSKEISTAIESSGGESSKISQSSIEKSAWISKTGITVKQEPKDEEERNIFAAIRVKEEDQDDESIPINIKMEPMEESNTMTTQSPSVNSFHRLTSEDADDNFSVRDILSADGDVFDYKISPTDRKRRRSDSSPASKLHRPSSSQRRSLKQNISNFQLEEEEDIAVLSKNRRKCASNNGKNKDKIMTFGNSDYPKPVYSYSCLVALALKNSATGKMHVAEIYSFICNTFPFFRTAPPGWKNSIRHNLSLSKWFAKIGVSEDNGGRSLCLWALNYEKLDKINAEIKRGRENRPDVARKAYANPSDMEAIEGGLKRMQHSRFNSRSSSAVELTKIGQQKSTGTDRYSFPRYYSQYSESRPLVRQSVDAEPLKSLLEARPMDTG